MHALLSCVTLVSAGLSSQSCQCHSITGTFFCKLMPNTHRQRRRDETVESRHEFATSWRQFRRVVGVNTPVGSRELGHGRRLRCAFVSPNPSAVVVNSCTHRRRDATKQFRRVGVGGVYWALVLRPTWYPTS